MIRPSLQACATVALLVLGAGSAVAEHKIDVLSRDVTSETALEGAQALYLNRCVGGCTIRSGPDSAMGNTSSIAGGGVAGGTFTVAESSKMTDDQWASFVTCMKEVYSPYNVTVTDVLPVGIQYNMEIVAGSPSDIGYNAPAGVEGVAIVAPGCTPLSNTITYSFLDQQQGDDDGDIVLSTCWTAAQESAHLWGLDHEYVFTDGMSACNDPMTYRDDCGGQKFFRNKFAKCGEFGPPTDNSPRPGCGLSNECGPTQNSHEKLTMVLGPGTPITTPPVISIVNPHAGVINEGAAIIASAQSQRGVATVDFYLNNFKWGSVVGAAFGQDGQPLSEYTFALPSNVPDGVIDLVAIASDDLGAATTSATVTVTKGSPCTDATTCLTGQQCAAGKCFWSAPTGMLGDTCTYPQFCTSGECEGTSADDQTCTIDCVPGVDGTCSTGYDCVATSTPTAGFCLPSGGGGGGCCSVGAASDSGVGSIAAHGGLAALVLVMLARRRRRA